MQQQLRATRSFLDKVVLPLQRYHNAVHVYAYDGSQCQKLWPHIRGLLGEHLVAWDAFKSKSQADGVKRTLDMFNSSVGDPTTYDLIIVGRFDTVWQLPINLWPTADFGVFNFFSVCEKRPNYCGGRPCSLPQLCVHDVVHAMPGSYFPSFRQILGKDICFNPAYKGGTGHRCYNQTAAAFGADHIAFITDWKPEVDVREPNGVLQVGYR